MVYKYEEIWLPMPDYEQKYEVSNVGRVRRIGIVYGSPPPPVLLNLKPSKRGYVYVHVVRGKALTVHRLVARAFLGEPENPAAEVNHKDGDRANNRISNLEWVTHAANSKHRFDILGANRLFGANAGKAGRADAV